MENVRYIMGRQPILNGLEEVVGYELLFRSSDSISSARFDDQFRATSNVIFSLLSGFGVKDTLGEHRGFINVDADMLMNDSIFLLPPENTGIELLESISFTPDLIKRCRELKDRGYLLAFDDHRFNPSLTELYGSAVEIIKLDLIQTQLEDVYREIELFSNFPVKLLAEKVDSRHVYLRCRKMGFELFQGYFFARPSLVQKTRMSNSLAVFFRLMEQLSNESEIEDIENTFKQSPALSYKLLLLVNSVSYATREKIRNLRHAITQIGMNQLKRWVQLAIFADDGGQGLNHPLMDTAAVRAAFMEELARADLANSHLLRHAKPEECFMVGTLSILKDIYDISMDDILANLNLSDDIQQALVSHGGDMGTLLCLAEMMERLELDEASDCLKRLKVKPESVLACQKRAYSWRKSLM